MAGILRKIEGKRREFRYVAPVQVPIIYGTSSKAHTPSTTSTTPPKTNNVNYSHVPISRDLGSGSYYITNSSSKTNKAQGANGSIYIGLWVDP